MNTRQTWQRLLKYAGKYRSYAIWAVVSAMISVASSLIGPYMIGRSIDHMIGKGNVEFDEVFRLLTLLGLVYAVGSLFGWLLTYLTNRLAYQTVNDLRSEMFDQMNVLPLKYHDTHPQGDSISRFVNDMDAVSDGLLQGFSTLLTGVVTIAGAIGLMLYTSPLMTLVVLLSAPAAYYVARFITMRSQQLFRDQARILGTLNGYVEEMVGGQKVVQTFHYEERSYDGFSAKNEELYQVGVKSQFISSLSNPATRLVNNVTFSVIALIGSVMVIGNGITVGALSSFLIYANLFAKPFNEITGVITQLQSATASAQRIFQVLDEPAETPDRRAEPDLPQGQGTISFNHVKFSYQPDRPLIRDLNLIVPPGTRIAIVGQTGAGKTTLVNLLMRFYDVDAGEIAIDGVNINRMSRDSLRRRFGMVLQDTWLIGGTVRDNIAYGNPEASEEEVVAAAKAANAHEFIKRLPDGYDTEISGTGDNLSQGQKQLMTIARVMLANPPMLILDEATSSIDTLTEIRIQQAFQKMMEGRTSFVIAHRLSTIREADLILYMKDGDVAESGSHNELLARGGYYAGLYNSQFTTANNNG
ncbi:ABC transporter ATP-binding protein [Paenibacillus sp. Marseille-P2973]|uniref:ABC transporter ATP-binding protein n=1 Tax=Paenibacillus sp. Marseille-P2973 TaxID=1871032 RepID=UPI001B385CF9|nr:ABC transporter ATP-binding protein [Paenibacillus sp. Marseille-P2973]MBQ4900182.1 ABC transporter ATP-binding protein [Paenibacillus sp. Marseille-P2973]